MTVQEIAEALNRGVRFFPLDKSPGDIHCGRAQVLQGMKDILWHIYRHGGFQFLSEHAVRHVSMKISTTDGDLKLQPPGLVTADIPAGAVIAMTGLRLDLAQGSPVPAGMPES